MERVCSCSTPQFIPVAFVYKLLVTFQVMSKECRTFMIKKLFWDACQFQYREMIKKLYIMSPACHLPQTFESIEQKYVPK